VWPFGKRLKDQNGTEKYRRWLRRWLMGSWQYIAAGTIAAALLAGIVWASLNTWNNDNAEPAAGDKSSVQSISSYSPANENLLTDPSRNKQTEQHQQENNGTTKENTSSGQNPSPETTAVAASVPTLALPVNGTAVSSFGYHYSPLFADYRFHSGIGLEAQENNEVYPCMPGKVLKVAGNAEQGYTVEMNHGGAWSSAYDGLASVAAVAGENLDSSDCLGQAAGTNGTITFTLYKNGKAVDPVPYMQKF